MSENSIRRSTQKKLFHPKTPVINRKRLALFLVILIPLLVFGAYEFGRVQLGIWGDSNRLRELRKDYFATEELPGLERVGREETPKQYFMSKTPAYIYQWFKPTEGTLEEARDRVIEIAKSRGWAQTEGSFGQEYWTGETHDKRGFYKKIYIEITKIGEESKNTVFDYQTLRIILN